jgi:glycosyltransferase involved in cell wall biosynthesis
MLTYHVGLLRKPFAVALLLRLLARGRSEITDEQGQRLAITFGLLLRLARKMAGDQLRKRGMVKRRLAEVEDLMLELDSGRPRGSPGSVDRNRSPAYLRTSFEFGLRSGGSVGHIAGVLNSLGDFFDSPLFLSTDFIPTVRSDLTTHIIRPDDAFWDYPELQELHFNKVFARRAAELLQGASIAFVYQRYSLNNYSGVKLARVKGVPFVLEYNGSEIWMARNWSRPLRHEGIAERIELLNLRAADVVVVGSRYLMERLVARGVMHSSILVNPNGVDPDVYSPDVDGGIIRQRYGLNGKIVIGFIGSFGRWHGAEVLASGFGQLLEAYPEFRQRVRLLMVGDGVTMGQVRASMAEFGTETECILAGSIPQEDGPSHLAACDILVSPHVPNLDQSPFFGSPTKVFEYMAMGKGIVASNLDQIGQVLENNHTAILTIPGDSSSLAAGLRTLIENEGLRKSLGAAARAEITEKYTWNQHTKRIVEALEERCHPR